MEGRAEPIVSVASVMREFRVYLPVWFLYLSTVGLLHASLANFPTAGFEALGLTPMDFVPTLAFPAVWLVLFFALRIQRSTRLVHRWKAWLALVVLLVVVPMAVLFGYHRHPLSHEELTTVFEASQFLWVGLLAAQIVWSRGWHALVMFFGVTFVYGLMLENTGIIMGYFFEPSFRLYLGPLPAPLCTMLGWSLVFYVTVAIVQQLGQWLPRLGRSVWGRAWATTLLALSMDAQLDPLASMSGVFWRWNDLLPPVFLGVPVINFVAWFGAFLPFSWFVFSILDRTDWSEGRKNWELFLRVAWASLLGGLLCFGLMALYEGGLDGPTFQILRAFSERLMPY